MQRPRLQKYVYDALVFTLSKYIFHVTVYTTSAVAKCLMLTVPGQLLASLFFIFDSIDLKI